MINKVFYFLIISILPLSTWAKKSLVELETDRLQIETKKALTFSQINITENNIQSLSDGLAARRNKLAQRLQSTQALKNNKWGTILGLKNITLLQRNLNTVRSIHQHDLNFIHEQIYRLDELKQEKQNLIRMNAQFNTLSQKLKGQEDLIALEEAEENRILIQEDRSSLLLLKGQLVKPIESNIKENYGLVKLNQYMIYNKGYSFAAASENSKSLSVQAVGPGTVIFRDVLNHWGESIILQHDGGYYSVYANVKNCTVQLEQKVQMSEKMCESTSDDLYFELRHFKITINPKNWIKDLL
ncbi:MAG: peptidoglycan DD-metalloendopeptidase family protein [Moraxellaceae bacterium]|nr:peptidoglycan DD-metalloendopeptidase family protein [Pseudobdellovibrionaceae bacterium]